jgi:hypothetical protein
MTNWRDYNASLVRRGDITFWFSEEVLDAWEHDNAEVRRGHPFVYSDRAIETLLTLRELFRLPYRQTEGLGRALAKLMGVEIAIPHHTSLVKRAAKLDINTQLADLKGPIDVVVDSTGLKVCGEGEWKVRQHGAGKRRQWRKIHFAVDPASHTIVAELMTESSVHDATAALPLLEEVDVELRAFYGDGAYDTWELREHLQTERISQVIPPRKNAVIQQHGNSAAEPLERDECLRQIRRDGREAWKESIGYHRRSLAETSMSRLKMTFGDRLKNREPPNQATEVALRTKILNAFVTFGMPLSLWI